MTAAIPNRRAIIDRRELADALALLQAKGEAALRQAATAILKPAMDAGRAEIARRLIAQPTNGRDCAAAQAFLTDQLLRLVYDFTTTRLYPLNNPTASERLCLAAVGGYGRGEMAPFSDVDIAFITPYKPTGWTEQVIESILYTLWDLGMKVGHSSRSIDELIRMAKDDLTIRTAYLEARYVWGDEGVYDEAGARLCNREAGGARCAS
jgi:[protein-PII] uridylyltransferase